MRTKVPADTQLMLKVAFLVTAGAFAAGLAAVFGSRRALGGGVARLRRGV